MPRTIFSMIQEARDRFGTAPFAYGKNNREWGYKTFNQTFDEARLFASFLIDRSYGRDATVAMFAEGSPEWIVGEYGIISAAYIAVPLSFKLLPEEVSYRLEHSEARVILTNSNHIEKIAETALQVSGKTGIPIDIVCLDKDRDLDTIHYPVEQLFRFDHTLEQGKAALNRTEKDLNSIAEECPEDRVVSISYTSGTTGNPKGIMLTHQNYWINSLDAVQIFKIPVTGYSNFVVLPVDHSFAQTVAIHASVHRGIAVYFVDSRGGGIAILRNIPLNLKEVQPVFMLTVPALSSNFMKKILTELDKRGGLVKRLFHLGLQTGIDYLGDNTKPAQTLKARLNGLMYLPLKRLILDRVRVQVFGKRAKFFSGGGASFDIGQQRFFRALGMPLYQGYGMTEAGPIISSNVPELVKLGTSGTALPNVEIKIVKDDGTVAAPGERGEILVRGPNVMAGYFKNPQATKDAIVNGWLHTGDLGYLDTDSFLTVTGRAKALLISADGEKYSPEGIEDAIINSARLIHQVLVWNDHKKFTCAFITLEEDLVKRAIKEHKLKTSEDLLDLIKESFYSFRMDPSYRNMVPPNWTPSTFQIIPEAFSERNGLINSTMKIIRYRVIETYIDLIEYIYSSEGSSYKNILNLEALGRFFIKGKSKV